VQNEAQNAVQNEVGANRRTNRRMTRRTTLCLCRKKTPSRIPLSLRTADRVTWTN